MEHNGVFNQWKIGFVFETFFKSLFLLFSLVTNTTEMPHFIFKHN